MHPLAKIRGAAPVKINNILLKFNLMVIALHRNKRERQGRAEAGAIKSRDRAGAGAEQE